MHHMKKMVWYLVSQGLYSDKIFKYKTVDQSTVDFWVKIHPDRIDLCVTITLKLIKRLHLAPWNNDLMQGII